MTLVARWWRTDPVTLRAATRAEYQAMTDVLIAELRDREETS